MNVGDVKPGDRTHGVLRQYFGLGGHYRSFKSAGCHYSADTDSAHLCAAGQGKPGVASWTLPTCIDPLHILDPAVYNLRHASEPMAHPGHRDGGMDRPGSNAVIEYLKEENPVVREVLGNWHPRL